MNDIISLTGRLRHQVLNARHGEISPRLLDELIRDAAADEGESGQADPEPWLLLAYIASESQQRPQAQRMLAQALRCQPEHPRARALQAYLERNAG